MLNQSQKVITLESITITLNRKTKVKNVSISIKPFEGVKVSFPWFMSYAKAEQFALQKLTWIKKNLKKINLLENQHTVFSPHQPFKTKDYTIQLQAIEYLKQPKLKTQLNRILIHYPLNQNHTESAIQDLMRQGIFKAWRKEAGKYLPSRLQKLAQKYNFKYSSIIIRKSKNKWGSCSFFNQITLNVYLMKLPWFLIDHVLLHELVHTQVKNHSADFWNLFSCISPEAKTLNKELSKYSIEIF